MVWCGVVYGVVCGVIWCGVVWCGVVWGGVVWCGVEWCGAPRATTCDHPRLRDAHAAACACSETDDIDVRGSKWVKKRDEVLQPKP